MNPWQAFWAGVAPHHTAALVAVALLPILWGLRRQMARVDAPRQAPTGAVARWASWLLAVAAAAHLALPLGHPAGPVLTAGFLGSGAAYGWLALRAWAGRRWRPPTALLVTATLVAYLVVSAAGGEEPDQVGIATVLVEIVLLGLALTSPRVPGRPRRLARAAASAATVSAVLLVGTATWLVAFAAHDAGGDVTLAGTRSASGPDHGTHDHATHDHGSHDHATGHAARTQAGVVMRPPGDAEPTRGQRLAAATLATATETATARFADLDAAFAAGYEASSRLDGVDVHLEHKGYARDGRVLDPTRPEILVYAIGDGRATLLGVVFVMERAGRPAPEPGGPITRWHAHNICFSLLPPGFGVVSPFGGCPPLTVNITTPEMMHVWRVDAGGGPFAESLDEAWVRAYHARNGRPFAG